MTLRWLAAVAGTTLALGMTVAVSRLLFGGASAFRGPFAALRDSWPLIYGAQALLAAAVGCSIARLTRVATPGRTVALIGAAWVGEWLVLLVGGTLLANELVPNMAWFFWLIATGGPLQPFAAIAGAAIESRTRSRR